MHLASAHRQVEAVERDRVTERLAQTVDPDRVLGGVHPRFTRSRVRRG